MRKNSTAPLLLIIFLLFSTASAQTCTLSSPISGVVTLDITGSDALRRLSSSTVPGQSAETSLNCTSTTVELRIDSVGFVGTTTFPTDRLVADISLNGVTLTYQEDSGGVTTNGPIDVTIAPNTDETIVAHLSVLSGSVIPPGNYEFFVTITATPQ